MSRRRYGNNAISQLSSQAGTMNDVGNNFMNMFTSFVPGTIEQLKAYTEANPYHEGTRAADNAAKNLENQRDQAFRQAERMGVDPNSGRFAGLREKYDRAIAAAKTSAQNMAMEKASDKTFGRMNSIANLGMRFGGLAESAYNAAGSMYGQAGGLQDSLNKFNNMLDESRGTYEGAFAGERDSANIFDQFKNLLLQGQNISPQGFTDNSSTENMKPVNYSSTPGGYWDGTTTNTPKVKKPKVSVGSSSSSSNGNYKYDFLAGNPEYDKNFK